jgi:PAS domain S-box-containing protein
MRERRQDRDADVPADHPAGPETTNVWAAGFLREMVRQLPLGVTVWHLDDPADSASLRLVEVNAAAETVLGRNADDLRGRRIAEILPDAIETKRAVIFAQAAATGRLTTVTDILTGPMSSPSGPRYAHLRLFPLPDRHVGVTLEDVTEEKRAQIEMHHANERFAKAFHSGPAAQVIVRLADSRILDVNEEFERLFGYSRDEVIGKPSNVHPFYPDERQMQEASRVMSGGSPLREFEMTIATKFGDLRDTLTWIEWIDIDGEPCVVGYHLDVTDRKRAENDLQRLNEELEQALRLRDDFLTVASHELKTPLTSLRLMYQLLERHIQLHPNNPDPERLLHHLEIGDRQLMRLIRLSNEILDVARPRHGGPRLECSDVDLVEIVSGAVAVVAAHLPPARDMIHIDAPTSLVGYWDRLRIEQLVVNLLTNAVKFGESKPITVTLARDNDVARITVWDQGIGIAVEDQERIFGRGERAVSAHHYGGLGIGLNIAQQIVHAHAGTISVESEPGQGSTFSVALPLRDARTAVIAGDR